jgi:plastocyanin
MSRPRTAFLAGLLVVGMTVLSTGSAAAAPRSVRVSRHPLAAATTLARVRIVDFAFRPKAITVSKGTRVRWTNRGGTTHTSTSNTGLWNSGNIAPGGTFSRLFRRAGTFRYHCAIHPSMTGRVVVK